MLGCARPGPPPVHDVDPRERGAAAVEFALVSVLLFTLLFGIVQYAIGFSERQAAVTSASEAARLLATGIRDTTLTARSVACTAAGNGLTTARALDAEFSAGPDGTLPPRLPGGTVTVTLHYHPARLGFPFVPYPSGDADGDFAVQARARVEQLGAVVVPVRLDLRDAACG